MLPGRDGVQRTLGGPRSLPVDAALIAAACESSPSPLARAAPLIKGELVTSRALGLTWCGLLSMDDDACHALGGVRCSLVLTPPPPRGRTTCSRPAGGGSCEGSGSIVCFERDRFCRAMRRADVLGVPPSAERGVGQ